MRFEIKKDNDRAAAYASIRVDPPSAKAIQGVFPELPARETRPCIYNIIISITQKKIAAA